MTLRQIELDSHDDELVSEVKQLIEAAMKKAHKPAGVARRLGVIATSFRNRGRPKARKATPFDGKCAVSGLPLERKFAVLDEMDQTAGYSGRLRWICQKANNSGNHSCGGC